MILSWVFQYLVQLGHITTRLAHVLLGLCLDLSKLLLAFLCGTINNTLFQAKHSTVA